MNVSDVESDFIATGLHGMMVSIHVYIVYESHSQSRTVTWCTHT